MNTEETVDLKGGILNLGVLFEQLREDKTPRKIQMNIPPESHSPLFDALLAHFGQAAPLKMELAGDGTIFVFVAPGIKLWTFINSGMPSATCWVEGVGEIVNIAGFYPHKPPTEI